MGAGIGDIRPHVANLVLNDGPFLGDLAPTPSVQDAIIELVQAAITGGTIVIPGLGVSAYRVTPTIEALYNGACQIPTITAVLNSAVAGTPPMVSGLVGDTGGNSASPTHTRAASPPTPAGALILGIVIIKSQQITAGPAGFQRIASNFDGNSDARTELWVKIATGGEQTFTWTADGANFWDVLIGVYTGVQSNGVVAVSCALQQPNGGSPYLVSAPLVGPWPTNSLMIFAGCNFGANVFQSVSNSGGSNLVLRAGALGESEFFAEIEF